MAIEGTTATTKDGPIGTSRAIKAATTTLRATAIDQPQKN